MMENMNRIMKIMVMYWLAFLNVLIAKKNIKFALFKLTSQLLPAVTLPQTITVHKVEDQILNELCRTCAGDHGGRVVTLSPPTSEIRV